MRISPAFIMGRRKKMKNLDEDTITLMVIILGSFIVSLIYDLVKG